MSNVHLHLSSFNAGELTPMLGARFGVEKQNQGCRKLRNFIPQVHGPAFRRPGMQYLGAAAGNDQKSNLRGFNFSTSTGAIMEFHADGLQIWQDGAQVELVNAVALPYSEAECFELQLAQVNDVVYLVHPNHMPRRLVRYANDDWRLEDIDWDWPALGDENVRSDEIATPTVAEIHSVPAHEWEQFIVPTGEQIAFDVVNADTSAAAKVARLQRIVSGAWVTVKTHSWTTVAPPAALLFTSTGNTFRMTYSGPETATGEITATYASGSQSLPLDDPQPESLQAVSVSAGEWQVHLDGTAGTLLAGTNPKLHIQKWTGAAWSTLKILTPLAGQIVSWRGPTLTAATDVRLKWQGQEMEGGVMSIEELAFPVSSSITLACSHTNGDDRTLTASDAIFQAGHVDSFWQIVHRRDSSHVAITRTGAPDPGAAYGATETAALRVQGSWDVFTYGSWDGTLYLEKFVNGTWEVYRSWESNHDRNIVANGSEDQEVELRLRVSAGTAISVSGAANPRFLLEATDARVYGLVKITALGALDSNGKATTATVDVLTTLHSTDATTLWTEGAWSDVKGFPRAVCIHGQRLWFGGTASEPLRLWGSVASDFENFRRSTYDDASVSFTPAETEANAIQGLRSFESELIIRTLGGEGTLSGGEDSAPITPTAVSYKSRSGYGSDFLPDVLLGGVVVFVQRGGRKLRQVAPRADGVTWSAADVSVLAPHITKAGVVQVAAMQHPFSLLWCVTGDGKLASMTFEQEQNVFAWHLHETDGTVESVAVVKGVDADEVWLSVLRNGQRNIERLDPEVFAQFLNDEWDDRERLIYCDGAVRYVFAEPAAELTGLDHLEGETVVLLGDGADMGTAVVVGGTVTLSESVSVAIAGLPFTSELQPTRREVPMADGTAQHRRWKLQRIGVTLHESLGGQVADKEDGRFEALNYRRVSDPMDAPPPLFSGDHEQVVMGTTGYGFDVTVKTSGPLPFNVCALTLFGDVYSE